MASDKTITFELTRRVKMTLGDIHEMLSGKVSLESIEKQLQHYTYQRDAGVIPISDHSESSSNYYTISEFIKENIEEDKDDDDDDEEAKWEEVYSMTLPESLAKQFKGPCVYFQTFGGGPEGGYVMFKSTLYKVARSWNEPWSVQKLPGHQLLHQVADERNGEPDKVLIIEID